MHNGLAGRCIVHHNLLSKLTSKTPVVLLEWPESVWCNGSTDDYKNTLEQSNSIPLHSCGALHYSTGRWVQTMSLVAKESAALISNKMLPADK